MPNSTYASPSTSSRQLSSAIYAPCHPRMFQLPRTHGILCSALCSLKYIPFHSPLTLSCNIFCRAFFYCFFIFIVTFTYNCVTMCVPIKYVQDFIRSAGLGGGMSAMTGLQRPTPPAATRETIHNKTVLSELITRWLERNVLIYQPSISSKLSSQESVGRTKLSLRDTNAYNDRR